MVLEIAEFTALPDKIEAFAAGIEQGAAVIRRAEGCVDVQVGHAVEDPAIFVLLIRWRRIEDHLETFRNGPLFAEYRSHIQGMFEGNARVRHYPLVP